ncbi:hypothetical protein EDD21DRAFT_381759 [Dissophora ornata]|nr:hypothetical protein EDD21DRAFT_381759 [Dissophora ornata]
MRSQVVSNIQFRQFENEREPNQEAQERHNVSNSRSGSSSRSDSMNALDHGQLSPSLEKHKDRPPQQQSPKRNKVNGHKHDSGVQQKLQSRGSRPVDAEVIPDVQEGQVYVMHEHDVCSYPQLHPTQYQQQEPVPQPHPQLHIQPYLHQHYYQYPHYYYPGYLLSYESILPHEFAPSDANAVVGVAEPGAGADNGGGAMPQRQ